MKHEQCKCKRILTIHQSKTNKLCDKCAKEHSADFHRFDIKKEDE